MALEVKQCKIVDMVTKLFKFNCGLLYIFLLCHIVKNVVPVRISTAFVNITIFNPVIFVSQ